MSMSREEVLRSDLYGILQTLDMDSCPLSGEWSGVNSLLHFKMDSQARHVRDL
jgi:hypothetical protein